MPVADEILQIQTVRLGFLSKQPDVLSPAGYSGWARDHTNISNAGCVDGYCIGQGVTSCPTGSLFTHPDIDTPAIVGISLKQGQPYRVNHATAKDVYLWQALNVHYSMGSPSSYCI